MSQQQRFVTLTFNKQHAIIDSKGAGIVEYDNLIFANSYHKQVENKEAGTCFF